MEQLSSFGWSIIDLDVTTRNSPELSNRESLADVIMREEFHNAISRLNPWLKEEQVEPLIDEFLNYGIQADALEINHKIQKHLVDGLTQTIFIPVLSMSLYVYLIIQTLKKKGLI